MTAALHDHPLASRCVVCGTPLAGPASVVFRLMGIGRSSRNPSLCTRCGEHVVEGRISEITVLFADLSDFTELTRALGPERTHEVLDTFLRTATTVLVGHGAFIDKYLGDGVMAFFNVPIRREDHAAQAVQAALEIRARLPELRDQFGLPLLALAALGAAANLYTVWHAGRLRRLMPLVSTGLDRRRTLLVAGSSALTLLVVLFEMAAHRFYHS